MVNYLHVRSILLKKNLNIKLMHSIIFGSTITYRVVGLRNERKIN